MSQGFLKFLAFIGVVSIVIAVAGREEKVPTFFKEKNLPKYSRADILDNNVNKDDNIVRILLEGDGHCSASIIDNNYAITAAHCLNSFQHRTLEIIGRKEKTSVRVVGYFNRLDYGIVMGDFRDFNKTPINTTTPMAAAPYATGVMMACGYPMGQKELICVSFEAVAEEDFMTAGTGALFPAMSGGPVFDSNEVQIGVNTAMGLGENRSLAGINSIIGLLAAFGIE